MFKKVLLCVGATLMFAACSQSQTQSAQIGQPYAKQMVQLQSQNGAKQTGHMTIETAGDNVHLTLQLDHPASAMYLVSMNLGTCEDIKDVKYAVNDVKGNISDTTLNKTNINELRNLVVVVKSSDGKMVVSCGMTTW